MTALKPPPIYDPVVGGDGKANLSWILYFTSLFNGDTGTAWTPTFTNLTTVGTPTITGTVYRLNQSISFFRVKIVPSTSTTSTAGTTYINNFPLTMSADGINFAVSGLLGSNSGMCDQASNNIYTPNWSAVTVPLTVVGIVEAN